MSPKSSSSIPHDHRLISRFEAAKLLGCTPQTIYCWIKKGILKGHKIDNHIFVGKKAIEALFDTAADVARMEEMLKHHKKELNAEIKSRDEAIIAELRDENKKLRSKTDNLTEEIENLREKVKELSIIETECELRERVSKLKNLLSETRNQLYKKNSKIESLERNLKIAKEKIASQNGSLLALRKASNNSKQLKAEIESLTKKLQSRDKRGYTIFEHKETTMKTWIKGLEEDLASKRDYIKSLETAQKELQEENAKLKAQVSLFLYSDAKVR